MKTIRQIADEIGVSKTAVNKQIANLGLRSGLRKNGNQFPIWFAFYRPPSTRCKGNLK